MEEIVRQLVNVESKIDELTKCLDRQNELQAEMIKLIRRLCEIQARRK